MMLMTFKTYLKVALRNRSIVFWVLAFPLIMMFMFQLMFSDVSDLMHVDPQPMAVAEDTNWNRCAGAAQVTKALSGSDEGADNNGSGTKNNGLIIAKPVPDVDAAKRMVADGKVKGYLYVDDNGALRMAVADTVVAVDDEYTSALMTAIEYSLQRYNETGRVVGAIEADNHIAMSDPRFISSIGSMSSFTRHVSATKTNPHRFARYYFSMLGMACLLGATISIYLVTLTQANLSALGIRSSVSPLHKVRQAGATLLASWCLSFMCLLIAFLVLRFVVGVGIGGREPAAVLAIVASTLMSSAMGLVIGALPKLSIRNKLALNVLLTCFLSLFTGLYGTQAMQVADNLRRTMPVVSRLNPARQVSDLFYDLLYCDNYRPFADGVTLIVATALVFILLAVTMLRRQRYEHL